MLENQTLRLQLDPLEREFTLEHDFCGSQVHDHLRGIVQKHGPGSPLHYNLLNDCIYELNCPPSKRYVVLQV